VCGLIVKGNDKIMDNKDVAVIVVTYNRKELLIQCIQSILKQTIEKLTVFVVDNNSNDGTQDLFQEKICDDRVRYYNTGLNIGGAGGFNYGMKKAYEEGYEYFWLMDDDSMPSPDALDRIHAASDLLNEDYGFLCSYVKWTDDSPCKMNIPRIDSNWLKSADLMHNNLVAVTSATFVGYFTRKAVVEKVGLPIKEFFIWNDDTNFSLRINQHYKSYIVLDSTITHKMLTNNNASIIKDTSGRYSRYFYAYRNICIKAF